MDYERLPGGLKEREQGIFYEAVYSFGDISAETEHAIFQDVKQRHFQQWKDTGIYANLIDSMSIELVGGGRTESMARVTYTDTEDPVAKERIFFRMSRTYFQGAALRKRTQKIPVLTIDKQEALIPHGRFTFDQACVLLDQVDELRKLREYGFLPSLNDTLEGLYGISSGVS